MTVNEADSAFERQPIEVSLGESSLPGVLLTPERSIAGCVLAHGAGAGHAHRLMERSAVVLARAGIATLRYDFAYMAAGSRRPDRAPRLHEAVRAAVDHAGEVWSDRGSDFPLIAGGRSMGGRMTSQAQAIEPLPGIRGLVFFAFPLHPPKKPGRERAEHLDDVALPMLFLAGTRDKLSLPEHLYPTLDHLGRSSERATLCEVEGGDHSFEVLKRSGRTVADVDDQLVEAVRSWTANSLGIRLEPNRS